VARYVVAFPPGTELLNVNSRVHWSKRAQVTAQLRRDAALLARHQKIPRLGKVRFTVVYHPPDRRRRDSSNIFLSAKAAIDGIADCCLADDSDAYVRSTLFLPGAAVKGGQLVITVTDVRSRDD
jgi:crossover junction endodeoxyribonuclease RusA